MKYESIINIYKECFPDQQGRRDAGYILPDGYIVDISNEGPLYCHGVEFSRKGEMIDWLSVHPDLNVRPRAISDAIMNDIGGIEFTIDNLHLQCVRLPQNAITPAQREPLREIIRRILERGSVKIEVLGTREYAEYDAVGNTADDIMAKIDVYYASGKLPER